MTDIAKIAAGLSEAQCDIMLGHMVEISPDEADQLIKMGLKEPSFFQKVEVVKMVWPITKKGLAVRSHLISQSEGRKRGA